MIKKEKQCVELYAHTHCLIGLIFQRKLLITTFHSSNKCISAQEEIGIVGSSSGITGVVVGHLDTQRTSGENDDTLTGIILTVSQR